MLEQSCTFVNAYYGILDYELLKPQYIVGTHENTGCPKKGIRNLNNLLKDTINQLSTQLCM